MKWKNIFSFFFFCRLSLSFLFFLQNPSKTEEGVSKGEVKLDSRDVAEAGHDPSRQSCAMTTDKDQVVITITPLFRDYSLFPDLTAPKVGDQIAYKVQD